MGSVTDTLLPEIGLVARGEPELDLRPPKTVDREAARTLHIRGILILERAFEARTLRSLRRVLKTVSKNFGAMVAAAEEPGEPVASFDDLAAINAGWAAEIEEQLIPLLLDTFAAGAQNTSLSMAGVTEIPEFVHTQSVGWMAGAGNRLARISDEAWVAVRDQLTLGLTEGESIDELQKRVRDTIGVVEARARTIARTEVIGSVNAGAYFEAKALGAETKSWLATEDGRTRLTHAQADDQSVGIDEMFKVGGAMLRFPHDPLGPPGETINCRCTALFDEAALCMCVPGWAQSETGEQLVAAASSSCACSDDDPLQLSINSLKALTRRENTAVDTYWGDPENGSSLINPRLRAGSQAGIQTTVEVLDDAIAKHRLAAPATVYRGISGSYLHELKVGDRIRDQAFLSTTTSRSAAERFAKALTPDEGNGKVMRLELPKGFSALPVPSGLNEYLLPRNTGFKVKAITDDEVVVGL